MSRAILDAATEKTLREEWSTLHVQAGELLTRVANDNGRAMTAEEKQENEKRYSRIDAIRARLDESKKFASYAIEEVEQGARRADVAVASAGDEGQTEYLAAENRLMFSAGDGEKFNRELFNKQLLKFAQTGQTRQLYTVTTGTDSGAYLPKQVLNPIQVRRLQNCIRAALAAAGMSTIEVSTPAAFSLPIEDDTANTGAAQAEDGGATELDATDGGLSISPTLYTSKQFWFSNTMVKANSFDVQALVLPMAQKRIDKAQESAWTTELLTATVGKTLAGQAAITYLELLDWEHSLAPAYRVDACFLVADSLYKALRGLVDDNNRPILDLDPTNTFVGKIHGRPVIVGDYFQDLTANHKCGAFASADALKIVDVMDQRLVRYVNYPGKPDQIGFEMFNNGDFGFVPKGVRLVKTAA